MKKRSNMKNTLTWIFTIVLCFVLFYICLRMYNHYRLIPKKITDTEKIQLLEESDPEVYEDIKSELKDLLNKQYKINPDKVGFFVYAPNSGDRFTLQICFKQQGTWKNISINGYSKLISDNLYRELVHVTEFN